MEPEEKSRRIRERVELKIPARVRGRDTAKHEWSEMSRLLDVTPFGARFNLTRPTEPGRLLHVTMAMPRALRCFDHVEDQYRVWSLVRNVKLLTPSEKLPAIMQVGVAFVGKYPPPSYLADPARLYQIANLQGKSGMWNLSEDSAEAVTEVPSIDQRLETRHTIPVEVSIEVFGSEGDELVTEKTVTENISRTGAAVFTSLNLERGCFVRMVSEHYQVSAIAAVRGRRPGPDGIPRLHIEFVGCEWPLIGIE